ncbi:hypothetical protein [Shewanella sp.]|uniref:hypothetical protein n=1 Tax=Shewanella sp. TaxID=50422 RepID=UPI002589A482|nr:hypothetical protein [Shewanella sp.]MCJ8305127.1 hypothetical protein [Shewanella sp.]NQY27668.1 hypothetical protein [Piscirickettsiaceae bacterium]
MTSRKKRIALFTIATFLILSLGIVIGIALARPYFKSINMVDLTISRAYQAYSYAKYFDNNEPTKAKRHLLLELELNLSKLMLMRDHLSGLQKEKVCHSLSAITENKKPLINLTNQIEDSDAHISRLESFMNKLEQCEKW